MAFSHAPIAVSCLEKRIYHRIVYFGIVDWKESGNPLLQRANLKVSQNVGFYATIRLASVIVPKLWQSQSRLVVAAPSAHPKQFLGLPRN